MKKQFTLLGTIEVSLGRKRLQSKRTEMRGLQIFHLLALRAVLVTALVLTSFLQL